MDKNKICFVIYTRDNRYYEECLYYLNSLVIPEECELEILSIHDEKSVSKAYNEAMRSSDAKYKVYLKDYNFIRNKYFIFDLINIFERDTNIGVVGLLGVKYLPTSLEFDGSSLKYGTIYKNIEGKLQLLEYGNSLSRYEEVMSIFGGVICTQYDIPWREDILNGDGYENISQCIEFNRQGYISVVPKQFEPWIVHDKGYFNDESNEEDKNAILNEYSKDIFPLVSILIPTYNRPDYFKLALDSALSQTYRNVEIIIGDDSTNDETERLIKEGYLSKYDNIIYYHNEKNLGQFDNDLKLYGMSNGKYINYLMDDDIFKTDKIEKMMNYFISDIDNDISLVTSHRAIINDVGKIGGNFGNTDNLFKEDTIIDGIDLGNFILKENFNCIGEPTTVLFKKGKLKEPFGVFNGRKYGCNVDQATWFNLLTNGKAVFINDVLSYFRIHGNQQLASDKMKLLGALDYAHEVLNARAKGFLLNDDDLNIASSLCLRYCKEVKKYFYGIEGKYKNEFNELQYNCKELEQIVDSYKIQHDLPLVSILIPTYNQTKYLKETLESALNQTYTNIEIIIGDDSTNDSVANFIKPYLDKYTNISYFKNDKHEMDYGFTNYVECLRRSNGDYINYLNHDDVFHPEKIEKMMKYFLENENVTVVTSARQQIDEFGNKLEMNGAFKRLFNQDTVIGGRDICRIVLNNLINCIGEPTTVLFKKRYIEEGKYGYFKDVRFWGIADVANWFTLLEYGDLIYISETLSYFRVHPDQSTYMEEVFVKGSLSWFDLIDCSYKSGIINGYEFKSILNKFLGVIMYQLNNYLIKNDRINIKLKDEVAKLQTRVINEIIYKRVEEKCYCNVCKTKIERFLPYPYKEHTSDMTFKYDVIGSDTDNYLCPNCHSNDRERHIFQYFNKLRIWEKNIINKKILHIAPERYIQQAIFNIETKEYVCGDLYPNNESIQKIDITDIKYEDEYFDFIICNHVLEHVPNDFKAIEEFYRVLKKGGHAVLQTPYSPIIYKSFEDEQINTKELRKKYFGQNDHVRIYGEDLFERIEKGGFSIKIVRNNDIFTKEEAIKYGFNDKEDLILVCKE